MAVELWDAADPIYVVAEDQVRAVVWLELTKHKMEKTKINMAALAPISQWFRFKSHISSSKNTKSTSSEDLCLMPSVSVTWRRSNGTSSASCTVELQREEISKLWKDYKAGEYEIPTQEEVVEAVEEVQEEFQEEVQERNQC